MILESPFYPAIISEQLQCQWVVHGVPGKRIKLEFQEFYLNKGHSNGDEACQTSYLSISDFMSDGTAKSDHGTFRLCGHNPRVYISRNADLKIDLHNDQSGAAMEKPQRFKVPFFAKIGCVKLLQIKMSVTDEKSIKVTGGELVVKKSLNTRKANSPRIQVQISKHL